MLAMPTRSVRSREPWNHGADPPWKSSEVRVNAKRLAASIAIAAALTALVGSGAASGAECLLEQIIHAIEPTLDQGSPFPGF